MKKILSLSLVLALALFLLASCAFPGGGNQGGSGDGGGQGGGQGGSGTGGEQAAPIRYEKGERVRYLGDTDLSLDSLSSDFANNTAAYLYTDSEEKEGKLFIVGECDNSLSELAYSKLGRMYSEGDGTAAYLIYANGGSVAIAYEGIVGRYAALERFFDEYESADLSSGVIAAEEFVAESYVKERSAKERADAFLALDGKLSTEGIAALESLYALYTEEAYIWLANLYCPEVGGFYYSASGRDTKGFLPDLESTAQALIFLSDSGMLAEYGDKFRYALPEEISTAILGFAKGCQDGEDGYFYHTQWGKDVNGTRLGRDLGWATRIISGFGSKPYWDTENGYSGEYGAPGTPASALTAPLGGSAVALVSQVIATAKPDYLTDLELFKKHLEEDFDLENASYKAGNAIESELGQIQNAGARFTEALIAFLNSKQKPNGLWEDSITYDSVNGLMKISVVYDSLNRPIPNVDAAMQSAITMLRSDAVPAHVCSVYNPWAAVSNILSSVQRVMGAAEADKLRAQFRAEADVLISVTLEKLLIFRKNDGGFSYYKKYSAPNSQGSSVALDKSVESDVNATNICINSIINSIFEVFGIAQVERYYPVDFALFRDTLSNLGDIVKDELLPAEEITFDNYDGYYGMEEGGVVTYPDDMAENKIGDGEKLGAGDYRWLESNIVRNPVEGSSMYDLVLRVKSKIDVGAEKPNATKPSSTRFFIPNANFQSLGDCYVFDADMYFTPGYGKVGSSGKATSDPIMQIFFMTDDLPCASLNLSVYTDGGVDYVKIGENFAGVDGKESNIAGGIPMGEWVNIRLEYYKLYEETEGGEVYKPRMKIFVNGSFKGDCDATITGIDDKGAVDYYDRKVDQISVSYYRYLSCEVYFNNVLAERTRKDYVDEVNPDAIVDAPIPDEEMRESYGFEDGLLNTSNVRNLVRVSDFGVYKYINASEGQTYNPAISYSIVTDPKNGANRVLRVKAERSTELDKPSRTEVMLYNSGAVGDEYIFSGDFYYDSSAIGVNGDLTHLIFLNGQDGQLYSLRIVAKSSAGKFTLSLVENNKVSGDTGSGLTLYEGLPTDEWFSLKVAFLKNSEGEVMGAEITVNDGEVIVDESYKAAATAASPVIKVALVHQRTNSSVLYLDDLSFGRSGEVRVPTVSTERVASFTDGFTTKYLKNYSYEGTTRLGVDDIDAVKMETLYTKFYLISDPKDAANKVLRAVNKNGGTMAGYTDVGISNESPAGNVYVFETRMYIEACTAGYNFAKICFQNAEDQSLLSLYASIDKSTSVLKIATTGSGAIPQAGTNLLADSGISVKKGEWFTLRIEFHHKGAAATAGDTKVKLYVNGTLAFDGKCYLALGSEVGHVRITHCKTAKSSAVYYDDVSLSRIEEKA